jgi:DNA invertase Pin-like site-specific DNA recombinase
MVLDGYVRVSQVRGRGGERFISPSEQRNQIAAWIRFRGARVGTIFEELDASGAKADRPDLQTAIARVESGASDGLVVAYLDRFGRSVAHGLAAIERIQAAGGSFVSVREGFDISTDVGRLSLQLMLSMAEYDLARIRSGWRAARARATARGVHMGGRAPAGYQHDDTRRLDPHPRHGPVVTEMFRRRAAGTTVPQLVRFLEQAAVPTAYGNTRWSVRAVSLMLANRVYLGELRNGDLVLDAAHPALVDLVTWQLAQHPRRRPSTRMAIRRCWAALSVVPAADT